MDRQINLYEAKTHLSRLVDEAADGAVISIAKDGKPMAKLGPLGGSGGRRPRQLGQLAAPASGVDRAQWWRDWKAADREIEADFETAAAQPLEPVQAQPARRRRTSGRHTRGRAQD